MRARQLSLSISPQEYESLRSAAANLRRVYSGEVRFDMVAENFDELEGEFDTIARRFVLFHLRAWSDLAEDRARVNRRLMNFMATARLLLDHTDHDLVTVCGEDSVERKSFKAACKRQHDENLSYRVLEALRNYGQHRDLPIHGITYGSTLELTGRRRILYTTNPTLDCTRLRAEGGFKKAILKELEVEGDEVALKPMLRGYMVGLGKVQKAVREIYEPHERGWLQTLEDAKSRLRALSGGVEPHPVWAVVREEGARDWVNDVDLFDGPIRQIIALRSKNPCVYKGVEETRTSE